MAGDAVRLLAVALAAVAGTMLVLYETAHARCSAPEVSAAVIAAATVQAASEARPADALSEACTACRADFPGGGKPLEITEEGRRELEREARATQQKRGDEAAAAYHYVDANDQDVTKYMKLLESRLGGEDPEEEYWVNLELELGAKRGGVLLDAGAGMGRVTLRYASLFRRVVAVEPDPDRYAACRWFMSKNSLPHTERIELVNGLLDDLRGMSGTFDIAVSSHVVQHIAIPTARAYFRRIRDLLKPDGVLVVSTTHVPHRAYGYEVYRPGRGTSPISEAEFNALGVTRNASGLPVRRFSAQRLRQELEETGFRPRRWFGYTYPRPRHAGFFAKQYGLPAELVQDAPVSQGFVSELRR